MLLKVAYSVFYLYYYFVNQQKLNEYLRDKDRFELTLETASSINSRGMLELGGFCRSNPVRTLAKYDYVPKKTLRASYVLEDRTANGVSGLNEWRDVPSGKFNVYGFRYDPEFGDINFRLAFLHNDGKTIERVQLVDMSDQETKILGNLCLSKALSDLEHISARFSATINVNV